MRAILLAAGKGTRISRHVTCPKSCLKVGGTSIIENSVRILKGKGFDITVVTGYSHESIIECLEGYDVDYCYNPFFSKTNSLGSLWTARRYLKPGEDLILANADVFWEDPLLDRLLDAPRRITMVADSSRYEVGDYFFYVKDGLVLRYGKELGLKERNYEYVGLAKVPGDRVAAFSERLERMIEEEKYDLWWENVLFDHLAEEPVHIVDVEDLFWSEVDYIEDYERIKAYLRTGDVRCKLDKRFIPVERRTGRHQHPPTINSRQQTYLHAYYTNPLSVNP